MKFIILPLVFAFTAVTPPAWAAGSPAELCSLAPSPLAVPGAFQASSGGRPTFEPGPCTVSRPCEFGPAAGVSCSGVYGCSMGAGPDGWEGWVQCDSGPYLACNLNPEGEYGD